MSQDMISMSRDGLMALQAAAVSSRPEILREASTRAEQPAFA